MPIHVTHCPCPHPPLPHTRPNSISTEWGSHVAIGLRIFRLLRVFRLIGESTTLYFLSLTFWYALKPCFYASLPTALFMAMFSQMSVHWFGDFETFDDLRFSFASYTAAQLVIYRLFTGDGWFEIMRTLGEQCVYPRCAESWGPPLLYIVQVSICRALCLMLSPFVGNLARC